MGLYVRSGGVRSGPFREREVAARIRQRSLTRGDELSASPDGPWTPVETTEVYLQSAAKPARAVGVPPQPVANAGPQAFATRGRGPRFWWVVGGSAAAVLTVGVMGVTAAVVIAWQSQTAVAESGVEPAAVDPVEAMLELDRQRAEAAGEERDALRTETERLRAEQNELNREIERLLSRRETLRAWSQSDVVLLDPGEAACGLRSEEGTYRLMAVARGAETEAAVHVARKFGAQFVPHDPQLAADLMRATQVQTLLSPSFVSRVDGHRLDIKVAEDSVKRSNDWVSFQTLPGRRRHVGFFSGADAESLTYVSLEGLRQRVDRDRILTGSAVRGSAEKLTWAVDEGEFLKQAVFAAAVALQESEVGPAFRSLAVDVAVDLPDVAAAKALRPDVTRDAGLLSGGYGYGHGWWGGYRDADEPNHPGWQIALNAWKADLAYRFELSSMVLADLDTDRADEKTARSLQSAATRLEASLAGLLSELSLPVMDPGRIDRLADRDAGAERALTRGLLQASCVSHVLKVSVAAATDGGPSPTTVSLVRQSDGQVLFAQTATTPDVSLADRANDRGGFRRYFLTSGRLMAVKPKRSWLKPRTRAVVATREDAGEDFRPIENPTVVPRGGRAFDREVLVYAEDGVGAYGDSRDGLAGEGGRLVYRPLFSEDRRSLARGEVQSARAINDADDVPRADVVRFLAARIAASVLPQAGRVASVDGDEVVVSISARSGLQPGDRVRLVRRFDEAGLTTDRPAGGGVREELLPIRLAIREVHRNHCVAYRESSGFEDVWPEDYALRVGDVVMSPRSRVRPVAIAPLAYVKPRRNTEVGEMLAKGRLAQGPKLLERNALQFGAELQNTLVDTLRRMDVPVRLLAVDADEVRRRRTADLRAANPHCVTDAAVLLPGPYAPSGYGDEGMRFEFVPAREVHAEQIRVAREMPEVAFVFGGTVTPLTTASYRVTTGVIPVDGGEGAELIRDKVDFTLSNGLLPR